MQAFEERIARRRAELGIVATKPNLELPIAPPVLEPEPDLEPEPVLEPEPPDLEYYEEDSEAPDSSHQPLHTDPQDLQTLSDLQDLPRTRIGVDLVGDDLDDDLYPDTNLPLRSFIEEAGESERLWMKREGSRDHGDVEWKAGWHFVRLLKGHPELQKLDAYSALRTVRSVLYDLTRCAVEGDSLDSEEDWEEVFEELCNCPPADFDATFLRVWPVIRYAPGGTPLAAACGLARRYPIFTERCQNGELHRYSRVLSIAGWLQYMVGDRPIYLPTHMLADLIDCSPRSISTYLKMAQEEGVLVLVKEYPRKSRKASEFRFATERWSILKDGPPKDE